MGDVVTALNGKPVRLSRDLHNIEGLLPLNARVSIALVRDKTPLNLIATLKAQVIRSANGVQLDARLNGVVITDLDEKLIQQGASGVMLKSVVNNSSLAQKGLRAGDLIIGINRTEITSLADLEALLKTKPRQLVLSIARSGRLYYLTL